MSINVEFEQLDRESKVNENIYKADRNFEKTKIALANARHKNDKIQADEFISKNGKTFQQVLEEIDKKRQEIIDLIRGINVNVQGTVLETQFMKKATFDKDNDGVVDRAKISEYATPFTTKKITVGGDSDKYYPVLINTDKNTKYINISEHLTHLTVFRRYNYKGPKSQSLQLELYCFADGWSANNHWYELKWKEKPSKIFGGFYLHKAEYSFILMLRGGGVEYTFEISGLNPQIEVKLDGYTFFHGDSSPYNMSIPPTTQELEGYTEKEGFQSNVIPDYLKNYATITYAKNNKISDCNNAIQNLTSYYVDRSTLNAPAGLSNKTGTLFCIAYDADWLTQIIFNHYDPEIYIRYKRSGTFRGWDNLILKSEYDKLVQRVQALEAKTQNL